MKGRSPANYTAAETLRDGRPIEIRAVRPDDRDLLLVALRKVSADSLYRRILAAKKEFSDAELRRLTEVDFAGIVALVAVLREGGNAMIVGGGRYFRLTACDSSRTAEVALLVDDAHQGLGIGSCLFRHLAAIAIDSRVNHFIAEVLSTNEGMFRVFERSGFPLVRTRGGSSVQVTIQLAATGSPDAPPRLPESRGPVNRSTADAPDGLGERDISHSGRSP